MWWRNNFQFDKHCLVSDVFIILGQYFVLGNRCLTPGAPGNAILAFVNPAIVMAYSKKMPNHVIVLIGHCVIRMIPIHKITKPFTLLSLNIAIFEDTLFA